MSTDALKVPHRKIFYPPCVSEAAGIPAGMSEPHDPHSHGPDCTCGAGLPPEGSAELAALTLQLTRQTAYRVNVHADHPWRKDGRCWYCGPCEERIGQEALIAQAMEDGLVTHPRFVLASDMASQNLLELTRRPAPAALPTGRGGARRGR